MIPATTPTYTLRLTDATVLSDISEIRMDLKQGNVVVQKFYTTGGIVIESPNLSVTLTQEESARFETGTLKIQAHGLTNSGAAWKTTVKNMRVEEALTTDILTTESATEADNEPDANGDEAGGGDNHESGDETE